MIDTRLQELADVLENWFVTKGKVAIAFSGGVDSALLLYVGSHALGRHCRGLFADSPLIARHQLAAARDFARHNNLVIEERYFFPFDLPGFCDNDADRCYLCKKALYGQLVDSLPRSWHLADGTNLDDDPAERPGSRVLVELAIATPYLDCAIGKRDIRELSRALGLSTWNKPSDSCLATRIPQHDRITEHDLQRIEGVEAALRDMGFEGIRAIPRHDRIHLTFREGDLERALEFRVRENIKKKMAVHSFSKVFLDLSERPGILAQVPVDGGIHRFN